ncbi:Leucine aminopeptidase 1 [Nowakowskiella sp. JEL0407]|nr:Leucine aminopeptidase 1 [Nowakowskiella sp. JEL0407]
MIKLCLLLLLARLCSCAILPFHVQKLFPAQNNLRLEIAPGNVVSVSEDKMLEMKRNGITFFDVTDGELPTYSNLKQNIAPEAPTQQELVKSLSSEISAPNLQKFLETLTNFPTRYFRSTSGTKSSQWIYTQLTSVKSQKSNPQTRISIRKFIHDWNQPSLIARIEAVNSTNHKVVIISAHQDSINGWNPYGTAPGADDDGSGTTTIFEAFRIIALSDFVPTHPLEFHFYSAEEGGLLGSQRVAAEYARRNVDVLAMIQFDMTGYSPATRTPTVAVGMDNVDPVTTKFLKALVKEYSTFKLVETKCGYACSDHASFWKVGYSSAFCTEAEIKDGSPYIHTTRDTFATINFEHVQEFVKVAIAWGVEWSSFSG